MSFCWRSCTTPRNVGDDATARSYSKSERRIFTQPGRDELVSVVRDAEDGGYSLWYLGSTLWEIYDEPDGGGDETLAVAGELLDESYET